MTDQEELDLYYQDIWDRINYEEGLEELYNKEKNNGNI